MTLDDFKQKILETTNESHADKLCLLWLKAGCDDFGIEGEIALEILKVVEKIFDQNFLDL